MPATSRAVARIRAATPANLAHLARCLQQGELVGVPSETVYGLAANAFDARACRRIFAAKRRPATDPLIVHIANASELARVAIPNASAELLAKKFWPGPLTLVLPKVPAIPDVVSAGLPSVAVRVPAHPLFRRLIRLAGIPLAAPSANPFGYISPTTAEHVRAGLGTRIAEILDGGPTRIGVESTILDLREPARPRLLRPGAITRAEIEKALGRKIRGLRRGSPAVPSAATAQVAPGSLSKHYSPRTPVTLHVRLPRTLAATEAYIFFRRPNRAAGSNIYWLDARGDSRRAARRLFALLRQLDAAGFRRIHVERAPPGAMAEAINDRLRRAAAA